MAIRIAESMNTYNPVLFTIDKMGYKVFVRLNERKNAIERWVARKEGSEFVAMNPISLLGIIMVGEMYGEDWRKVDYGNKYDEILDKAGI
ncbi:MAG: hypothetical protein LBH05_06150 [Deferribacteraceae bacterium]|jgi:hypothetical protein|nr:hypothetical protein [Deferribacteraceae bacterium]